MNPSGFRVAFVVHGRCADAYIKARTDRSLKQATCRTPAEAAEFAAALREKIAMGGVTPPVAALSAPFDTRQRAEQFAQLARRDGCTGKFLKVKSVPDEIRAMAAI